MKKYLFLLLVVMMVVTSFGCAGNSSNTESSSAPADSSAPAASDAKEPIELTIAHIYSPEHNEHVALSKFKEEIEKKSEGAIKVTIYPAGQMGSEREITEQIKLGTIDMGDSGGGMWAAFVPKAAVFELPFLYESIEHQTKVMHEVGLKAAQEMLVPENLRPLFYFTTSIRGSILKTKPIYTADDIKGIKMRVPENPVYVDTWKALKANPTTTPWSEAYTAIAAGVVDGAEVNPETLVSAKLHEVTNYFSRTQHMAAAHFVTINEQKWKSFTTEQQKIIIDAGAAAEAWQLKEAVKNEEIAINSMKEAGVQINDMNPGERDKLIEMSKPLYEYYGEKYGAVDLIEKILAVD